MMCSNGYLYPATGDLVTIGVRHLHHDGEPAPDPDYSYFSRVHGDFKRDYSLKLDVRVEDGTLALVVGQELRPPNDMEPYFAVLLLTGESLGHAVWLNHWFLRVDAPFEDALG